MLLRDEGGRDRPNGRAELLHVLRRAAYRYAFRFLRKVRTLLRGRAATRRRRGDRRRLPRRCVRAGGGARERAQATPMDRVPAHGGRAFPLLLFAPPADGC